MTLSKDLAPRLLAGSGTAALVIGVGLFASSRPARTAGGPIPVVISNAPLHVSDAEAARTPFQITLTPAVESLSLPHGVLVPIDYLGTFRVPDGKRLLLQGLSASFSSFQQTEAPLITLSTVVGGSPGSHFFPDVPQPADAVNTILPEQALTLYADPSSTVTVRVNNFNTASDIRDSGVQVTLSGYLVDAP